DFVGEMSDAGEVLGAIDAVVPRYIERADRGEVIYPACKRKPADPEGDLRSIWEHTRLEAVRYITMVPGRQAALLLEPARQLAMIDAFLRLLPHDKTVIDFTGDAADDLAIAIIAGLNWLNHCSVLAGVDHHRYSGTLRSFRKIAGIAQQWWTMEDAQARCAQMLQAKEKPPLMLHLVWQDYTGLAKEIASAAIFGPAIDKTVARRRDMLEKEFAERPAERDAAIAELTDTMACFEAAREPDDLLE
ncbi:MAG TPA: hypothetical protein VGD75_19765, partial [Bradyrhizobium sp.]